MCCTFSRYTEVYPPIGLTTNNDGPIITVAMATKKRIPHWRKLREERAKQSGRRRARLAAAIGFETLGEHPGQALVWWRPSVYMAHECRSIGLPGIAIPTLVSSEDELLAMLLAMEQGIEAWSRGEMVEGGFVCGKCKGEQNHE